MMAAIFITYAVIVWLVEKANVQLNLAQASFACRRARRATPPFTPATSRLPASFAWR